MGNILSGLVLVNGTDIWTEYGVFLVEDRRGGMENLTAILTPSKAKKDTAVDIREEHGEKYSPVLTPRNEARDVTLHFALYNKTQAGWMKQYFAFVNFLKQGKDGWLEIRFPQLDLKLPVKAAAYTKLLCLCEFPEAREGRLAGDPFPPAGSAAAGEVCRLYEVHPADLSVDGRCACRKVPGKVPGTETDYITIQTLLEYASNDI
mgnify:CR=1 FL=1